MTVWKGLKREEDTKKKKQKRRRGRRHTWRLSIVTIYTRIFLVLRHHRGLRTRNSSLAPHQRNCCCASRKVVSIKSSWCEKSTRPREVSYPQGPSAHNTYKQHFLRMKLRQTFRYSRFFYDRCCKYFPKFTICYGYTDTMVLLCYIVTYPLLYSFHTTCENCVQMT